MFARSIQNSVERHASGGVERALRFAPRGTVSSPRRITRIALFNTSSKPDSMSETADIVFLFDVDNTLLDNDRVQDHLREHLEQAYGPAARDRYWEIFEELR